MKPCFLDTYIHTRKLVYAPDDLRELTDDLTAIWSGWQIRVKSGFVTDGASIPRIAWRVIDHPWAKFLPAAVIHDALYQSEHFERETADRCFRDLMECLGVGSLKRTAMYSAVRMFGGAVWAGHEPEGVATAKAFLEVTYA